MGDNSAYPSCRTGR